MSYEDDYGYDYDPDDLVPLKTKKKYHCGIVHQTEKAILFRISTNYGVWLPKSIIIDYDDDIVKFKCKNTFKPSKTLLTKV